MKIKFNKAKCLELLKKRANLRQEGKLLSDDDKVRNSELIHYLSLLEDQILWESRTDYIKLLHLLINNKISFNQFIHRFCNLRNSNLSSAQVLKKELEKEAVNNLMESSQVNIDFNVKSYGFTELVSYLHSLVDIWNPNVTLDMNLKHPELFSYGLSEEYLRLIIEEDFLPKFKKY